MYLSERPLLRIITLCALYVAQGIPFGYVTITLKAHLAGHDLEAEQIAGLLALCTLPWSFKWVWGPLIDSVTIPGMGRRRPWILFAQSCMILTIGLMVMIPDLIAGYQALAWMILLLNIFASLQDVSVDALAVDLLKEQERGRANGLMFGSAYFGTFLGGAFLGYIVAHAGIVPALIVQIILLSLIMLFPLLLRERPGDLLLGISFTKPINQSEHHVLHAPLVVLQNLLRAFSFRSTLFGAVLALVVRIGIGISTVVGVELIMKHLGWKQEDFTTLEGTASLVFGLTGSVLGGFLADKCGVKRYLVVTSTLLAILWGGFSVVPGLWESKPFIASFVMAQEFLAALISVGLFSLFMGISWPKVAATQFTAYMAFLNLSMTCGTWFAGKIMSSMTKNQSSLTTEQFQTLFLLIGAFQFLSVLVVLLIDPEETRRKLSSNGGDEQTFDSEK